MSPGEVAQDKRKEDCARRGKIGPNMEGFLSLPRDKNWLARSDLGSFEIQHSGFGDYMVVLEKNKVA